MINPVQISFHGIERSASLEALVRQQADLLDRFNDSIVGCRVAVEQPHQRHRHGSHVHVRIDLTIPGGELVVNRDPAEHAGAEDPEVAVRQAFRAARRQLQDATRKRRPHPHETEEPNHARVVDVSPDHGFLLTPEGRQIYFHRNAVLGDGAWKRLEVGDAVRFVEEEGIEGPQASTVVPLHTRHA